MIRQLPYNFSPAQHYYFAVFLLFGAYVLLNPFKPRKPLEGKSVILFKKEGYDARTGQWINKKPSVFAYPISQITYEQVKNWYATDSGTNNPNHLPLQQPRDGYSYIYVPYKDPAHPNVTGMSSQGEDGYKGYWYADDLSKATDSTNAHGDVLSIQAPKDNTPASLGYGGYDARTGNWINTKPGFDAFTISHSTYTRVKNWFATSYGSVNPINLPVEAPRKDFTYIYVPYKDPAHPGVIGMSFQGDGVFRGYWYADKIGASNDTVSGKMQIQPPVQAPIAAPVPSGSAPDNTQPVEQSQ